MSCARESVTVGRDASVVAGPSTSSTMMSSLHSINEEGAMHILADMLDALDTHGLAIFSELGHGDGRQLSSPKTWASALAVLATSPPLNAMVADTLLERVSAALSVEIRVYHSAVMCGSGPLSAEVVVPALERLSKVYHQVHPYLLRWCSALHTPGVAALLAVRLRCALLQIDLVTGKEPPGRQALFSFLRRHGRLLLAKQWKAAGGDEEDAGDSECDGALGGAVDAGNSTLAPGSASQVPDSLMACLHRLSLDRSEEVKHLWRSVLEDGIHDRLSDLSDNFSTRIVHKHLSWLEHSVVPFVRMVLPLCEEESDAFCRSSGNLSGRTSTNHLGEDVRTTPESCHAMPGCGQEGDACPSSQTNEAVRAEREAWCVDLRLLLLHTYARRRLDSFWEILSDYPDSIPALEDMHYCLQSTPESGLKTELVQTVRHLLSSRLHRAGTRTEDILAILINTIHAFCILFPRNEQSSVVFSVTSDTLEHLRRRKDCVPAVVQAVMQPGGAMNVALPSLSQAVPEGLAGALGLDGNAGSKEGELHPAASRDRPDVVRVLLTSIPRRALVDEYQQMLAEQLLQKPMHEFDTTPEEEVLERLRHVFGETALDRCAVMVRDIQMSRRISQQLREQLGRSPTSNRLLPFGPATISVPAAAPAASVSVLSMTTWPPPARCIFANGGDSGFAAAPLKFRPHSALQKEMDALADAYKRLKYNQRITWLPSLCRVALELTQRDPSKGNALVKVSHVLSLFDASIVLYVKDLTKGASSSTSASLGAISSLIHVPVNELRVHVQRLSPVVLVFDPATNLVTMQLRVAASADFVFMEDRETDGESGKPAGLPPERVKLMERMVTSLLKTRGAQSSTAIHSSLKLLGKFEGSSADLVELLRSFVGRGLIVLNDAKQYALPPK